MFFLMMSTIYSIWGLIVANYKAWLAVSVISVPLSISLAVASGATPLQGILTAIFAGICAAIFGWSKFNIVWPTGALSWLILAFAITHGYAFIPFVAIVSGFIILLVRSLKLTKYITLIPSTALHGFILWVALIIVVNQLNGALGLVWLPSHDTLFANFLETIRHISETNLATFILFAFSFVFLQLIKKYFPKMPGIIPVSIVGIIIWYFIKEGSIPFQILLLSDSFPDLAFRLWESVNRSSLLHGFTVNIPLYADIAIAAFTISIVAILETVISAKIADKVTKTKFHESKEMFGLWIANIASWFAGWMPATAALVRTSLNVRSWANSSISAVINALCIVLISWLFFDYFIYIPLSVISAILISIALAMIDSKALKKIYYYDRLSLYIIVLVAVITFIRDPIYGIIVGTSIALLAYLYNTSQGHLYATVFRENQYIGKMYFSHYLKQQQDHDVIVCKFGGDISFLNINASIKQIAKIHKKVQLILSFSDISYIDIDGIEIFEEMIDMIAAKDCSVYFAWVHHRLHSIFSKTHYFQKLLAHDKVFLSTSAALRAIGLR
jgi:SulP family sulfate permease